MLNITKNRKYEVLYSVFRSAKSLVSAGSLLMWNIGKISYKSRLFTALTRHLHLNCPQSCYRSSTYRDLLIIISMRVRTIHRMIRRSPVPSRSVLLSFTLNFTSAFSTLPRMNQFPYSCTIDAEPLHHYTRGGYHPVTLGSFLANGRYKILQKLGWGGYSTVWAARDERLYTIFSLI